MCSKHDIHSEAFHIITCVIVEDYIHSEGDTCVFVFFGISFPKRDPDVPRGRQSEKPKKRGRDTRAATPSAGREEADVSPCY